MELHPSAYAHARQVGWKTCRNALRAVITDTCPLVGPAFADTRDVGTPGHGGEKEPKNRHDAPPRKGVRTLRGGNKHFSLAA
jgi:hypothetical protein